TGTISANDSNSPKTVTVDCTGGRKILSGGYTFSAGTAGVGVRDNRAVDDDTWTVTAEEMDTGITGNWTLQAFAICATGAP
ncbi:MAG TPA: hypothetical protein VNE71_04580, partial [Myxococcota bacterium]|nr:hypothetical protein [Myxococcota bacterium]